MSFSIRGYPTLEARFVVDKLYREMNFEHNRNQITMNQLSAYILTFNSERYLLEILNAIHEVVDEIIILDSGSTDNTEHIVSQCPKAKFVYRKFDNFRDQRNFAADTCLFDHVLFLDSDEIPNQVLVDAIGKIKKEGFALDAYTVKRHWEVMGKKVHCIYPIVSPDHPVRLINKKKVSFKNTSKTVHETLVGYNKTRLIDGSLLHHTFHTRDELFQKVELYTNLAAKDLVDTKKKIGLQKLIISPIAAFIKWYLIKGGFKDGWVGLTLGRYAYSYTKKKYQKARKLRAML